MIPNLERRYKDGSESAREDIEQYMSAKPCPVCRGARLKPETLAVTVGDRNIVQIGAYSIVNAMRYFEALTRELDESAEPFSYNGNGNGKHGAGKANGRAKLNGTRKVAGNGHSIWPSGEGVKNFAQNLPLSDPRDPADVAPLSERDQIIARQILKEIKARLGFLVNVGLDYLSLNRAANTLSGGEAQRIRLATQIGSSLMGVLYILDEPSIGLHQRDNARLIETLTRLRDLGNTLLVVEHDEETMRAADHIIDMGPGAGEHGGYVVAEGDIRAIDANPKSLTGQYLSGARSVATPAQRRPGNGVRAGDPWRAREQPQRTSMSRSRWASSSSSPASPARAKARWSTRSSTSGWRSSSTARASVPATHDTIEGVERLDKVINIDQSPIGRTPRSNPATYTGAFTHIRELFAQVPEARLRGYLPGRFSFNVKGGRCEVCKGEGHDQDRDELPARCLRALRGVQGASATTARRWRSTSRARRSPMCST